MGVLKDFSCCLVGEWSRFSCCDMSLDSERLSGCKIVMTVEGYTEMLVWGKACGLSPAGCPKVCVIPMLCCSESSFTSELYVVQFDLRSLLRVVLTVIRVNVRSINNLRYYMVCVTWAWEGCSWILLRCYASMGVAILSYQMLYFLALGQVGESAIDGLIVRLYVVLVSVWGILVNQLWLTEV